MNVTLSVIIATHQRARLLARALTSVYNQIVPCHQVIVVADAADDATYRCVTQYLRPGDLFVQRQGVPGPAASRNLGLQLITGDFVLFLDDDDTYRPNFFSSLTPVIAHSDQNIIYYTNFEVIKEIRAEDAWHEQNVLAIDLSQHSQDKIYVKNFIPNNCVIFPARIASRISFDVEIAYEDWDFLLSACAHGVLRHLPIFGPCVHKNEYQYSTEQQRGNSNNPQLLECYLKVYKKHPAPNTEIDNQRQQLLPLPIADFINTGLIKCYCINPDHRSSRWTECLHEFSRIGLPKITRVPARQSIGYFQDCATDHVACVAQSILDNDEMCLIMEDDVVFIVKSWVEVENIVKELFALDPMWDILCLGVNPDPKELNRNGYPIRISPSLYRIFGGFASHAYFVRRSIYLKIIDLWKSYHHLAIPHDVIYSHILLPSVHAYGVKPAVALRRIDFSQHLRPAQESK